MAEEVASTRVVIKANLQFTILGMEPILDSFSGSKTTDPANENLPRVLFFDSEFVQIQIYGIEKNPASLANTRGRAHPLRTFETCDARRSWAPGLVAHSRQPRAWGRRTLHRRNPRRPPRCQ